MVPLPIDSLLPEVVDSLRTNRSLVLVAPPGAGKTTRIPPAILAAGLLAAEHPTLIMLQPRRVAARAAAGRIAEERDWTLGKEVGYHVRFDRRFSPSTRLRILTEGILTRQLVDDPFLQGIGAVLLDEFHERNLHSDLALAMLREIQQSVRPDLIVLVMSATLEARPVARFLGDCPILQSQGRTHPIDVRFDPYARPMDLGELPGRIAHALGQVLQTNAQDAGDILVFLPGVHEINRTIHQLQPLAVQHNLLLLPLHGSLTAEDQQLALRPTERRKVILATNIAQTSLTIDGVRTVIDTGLSRIASYDPDRGVDRLFIHRISNASATQRAGRAGRTAPGQCIRLWSAKDNQTRDDFETPEIHRVDLASTVLSLHAWGSTKIANFGWYDAPPANTLAAAERLLLMLGALRRHNQSLSITPLGRKLLSFPLHPRLARLFVAAIEAGLIKQGATLAALLSEEDILRPPAEGSPRIPHTRGDSDLLLRMQWLDDPNSAPVELNYPALNQVRRIRDNLLFIARRHPVEQTDQEQSAFRLLLLAYGDRVCRRRGEGSDTALMVGGIGVRLAAESVVRDAEFFIALDARQDQRSITRESRVRLASAIDPDWLRELFPHAIQHVRQAVYDPQRDRVVGLGQTFYHDLLIQQDADAAVEADEAAAILSLAARPQALRIFQDNPAARLLLDRIEFLRRHMPEHPWPTFDENTLADLLATMTAGKRSVQQLREAPLSSLIQSQLVYPLDRLLDQHAPETLMVPTGNRIRLTYAPNQPPILAVRLQELFGLADTPRLAGGRVPVLLHLLAPNYRPVQITTDLKSFWSNAYFQVRKDLRAQYPKHSWPENPLTAPPQAKGSRRQQQ
ncbi:MAG: ATP-dependent helicase HrpB [Phycisphaerales bacterium]|nr:ATP-dependent helicase HrpB [Phycisphaerales bacterium]